jgi:hypothetical protein
VSEDEAAAHGAEVHHIDRGGSFTFQDRASSSVSDHRPRSHAGRRAVPAEARGRGDPRADIGVGSIAAMTSDRGVAGDDRCARSGCVWWTRVTSTDSRSTATPNCPGSEGSSLRTARQRRHVLSAIAGEASRGRDASAGAWPLPPHLPLAYEPAPAGRRRAFAPPCAGRGVSDVHHAAALGFDRQADAYDRGRPAILRTPSFVIETLGIGPGAMVVDLAAGTGKLTRNSCPPCRAHATNPWPACGCRGRCRMSGD